MALLFLLTEIAHRVPIVYLTHSGCDTGKVSHRFHQTGLAASPMSQQNHITNLIRCVNIHAL